jgi:hypothetical protein
MRRAQRFSPIGSNPALRCKSLSFGA